MEGMSLDTKDKVLRKELLKLLDGYSHMDFDEAVGKFPLDFINTNPPHVSYTPWHLLEHIRISQNDLLEYIVSKNYREKSWPKDYWPEKNKKATKTLWQKTIVEYKKDFEKLKSIVADQKTDLFKTIGGNPEHTIFREILLAGDHASYHIGEFATWREIMKTGPKNRKE